mmetsp:Transcript_146756/g.471054  ORF Transcript_146756/g.471054 Transcript_146756/m.471054 type:complete len:241 (+) Transcript_146756:4149-4871(+)
MRFARAAHHLGAPRGDWLLRGPKRQGEWCQGCMGDSVPDVALLDRTDDDEFGQADTSEDHVRHHPRRAQPRCPAKAVCRRGRQQGRLPVAVHAQVLLARGSRRCLYADLRRQVALRLRVPRQRPPPRRDPSDGSHLRHGHPGPPPLHGLRAGRPCRNRQNREHQGLGKRGRQSMLRHQRRAGDGLRHPRQHLQRPQCIWYLGLLRRVQPLGARSALRVHRAIQVRVRCNQSEAEEVPVAG